MQFGIRAPARAVAAAADEALIECDGLWKFYPGAEAAAPDVATVSGLDMGVTVVAPVTGPLPQAVAASVGVLLMF